MIARWGARGLADFFLPVIEGIEGPVSACFNQKAGTPFHRGSGSLMGHLVRQQ